MLNMMSPKDLEDIKNGNVPSTHYQYNTKYQPKRKMEKRKAVREQILDLVGDFYPVWDCEDN